MVSVWRGGDGLPQNPSPEDAAYVALVLQRQTPEIKEGAVVVKTIAREAGLRTKIAVAAPIPGTPLEPASAIAARECKSSPKNSTAKRSK